MEIVQIISSPYIFNQITRDLTKLNPGQNISVKLREKDKWRMGKCISAQDPQSYIVEGHEYRRNIRDIITLPSGLNHNEECKGQNPLLAFVSVE
ncbi:hypothetical protein LAZ67_9002143 [Cordylochernes scorpioides]|uniref:Uncharacterized protein n=1 Tax=Cordylochernes scorpioides TaxID=51811 RepID=A0ABY6KWX9_9ARAC|nr:hypothetical protein LAZ67_9002143 [Cordylochernes scorpioides]